MSISTEVNPVVTKRANKLEIVAIQGVRDKTQAVKDLAIEHNYDLNKILYVGNDINDYDVMTNVGLSACPSDSHEEVKSISSINLNSKGGEGIVRELLEKVFDKFYEKGDELKGLKKNLFYWAIKIGLNYTPFKSQSFLYQIKLKIAYKLILSKWKDALGGNLVHIQSGSAALQPRLIKVFSAAKMTIVEGYGLTETSPAITINEKSIEGFKIGSVGKVIDGVKIKIASDGEILCKGPNIMLGYFKNKELTKQCMTGEYFHTGDIGEIDNNGFLTITDRKKEMFKTSGGKYIAPQVLESLIKQSSFVEQIAVIGENQKMPSAIIQPNFEFCLQWLKEKGISCENNLEKICKQEELLNQFEEEIDFYNKSFAQWEKIKKFKLTPEVWSIEKEHLTPTMKVKRKVIKEKFKELVNEIYN